MDTLRIALDAMGGDRAPAAPVEGAVRALAGGSSEVEGLELVLVGDREAIHAEVDRQAPDEAVRKRLRIEHAPHVAGMNDDPVRAVMKNADNSARVAAELLRDGHVEGVVNMGSTGAAVAAARVCCGLLEGVKRPGIAVPFPRPGGATVVVDCGANPDAHPQHLHQYAIMASLYAQAALGVAEPRIGILSIGEEEHKGNQLVHDTWTFFREHPLPRFIGNVEPRELFEDRADVVVCDGFSGNVVLKGAEGMAEYLIGTLRATLPPGPDADKVLRRLVGSVDYAAYGGAPLLGVRGAYLIGHGRSDARAVVNAITAVGRLVAGGVAARSVEQLAAAMHEGNES